MKLPILCLLINAQLPDNLSKPEVFELVTLEHAGNQQE